MTTWDHALFEAIRARDVEGARRALAQGASVAAVNERGRTPLFNAVGFEDPALIALLLEMRADPNEGLPAALMRGNAALAQQLVEAGADPSARLTASGQTLLHAACDAGLIELVRYLVKERHLDLDARTENGVSARHLAERLGLDLDDL
jgi:ankyrin repeat protein